MHNQTFFQDLHITGNASDGKVSWIVGGEALYQRDDYERLLVTSPCAFNLVSSFCNGTPSQPVCVKPLPTSTNCPMPFPLLYGNSSITDQSIESFAAYASLEYSIGDFTLVGEGRFTHNSKKATQGITALYTDTYTRLPTTC